MTAYACWKSKIKTKLIKKLKTQKCSLENP